MASGPPPPPKEPELFPGPFEDLHKASRDVMPMPFEGIKLASNAASTPHFQATHTLALTAAQPSSYKFGATYVGDKKGPEAGDQYPVLVSEMDTAGSLNAQVIHQLTKRIRGRFILQTEETSWENLQMDTTYSGRDFTATAVVANPDPLAGQGTLVGQYLQGFSPNFALGTELFYSRGSQGERTRMSLAALFRQPRWQLAATLSPSSLQASYHLRHNDNVQFGAELTSSMAEPMKHSTLMVGYRLDVPVANVTFRGMMDTNWTVASVLEKRLVPYPFTFSLSAMLSHEQQAARVGVGLTIG